MSVLGAYISFFATFLCTPGAFQVYVIVAVLRFISNPPEAFSGLQ